MRILKLVLIVFAGLLLTNCGEKTNGDVVAVVNPVGEGGTETEVTTNHYIGNTKQLRYYVGGWYGLAPNYRIDLEMIVDSQGMIQGKLDTPDCKISASIDAQDYGDLVALVEGAKLITTSNGIRVDGGYNQITTTDDQGAETTYYVRRSDGASVPLMEEEDAKKVEAQLDLIVDKMEAGQPCADPSVSDISTFSYREVIRTPLLAAPTNGNLLSNEPVIARDFVISNLGDRLVVNGTEVDRSSPNATCTKVVSNREISASMIADMEKVVFTRRQVVCMYMPIDITVYGKTLTNDYRIEGSPGCHDIVGVSNHQDFQRKFLNWLNRQPARCQNLN